MEKHGFTLGMQEVLDVAKEYVERQILSLKNLEPLEKGKKGFYGDPFIIYEFYDILVKEIERLSLADKPGHIFNLDENAFCTDPSQMELVAGVGQKTHWQIEKQRPILLIMDGHPTHLDMNTAQFSRRTDIMIIKLPAHTTDVLQPLDKTYFQSLKNSWEKKLVSWYRDNNRKLQKNEFVNLLCEVWTEGLKPENIISGFRSTGIYPTDRNKYPVSRFNLDKHQRYLESQHQPDHPIKQRRKFDPGAKVITSEKYTNLQKENAKVKGTVKKQIEEDEEATNEDESPAPLDDDSSLEDVDLLEPQKI
ncbi:hypothetical protein PR048_028542 [Dryococelus australis]|uniref:DDE-1 domain-containing protein n=1 Tax=Dryococelus australis TaxID=614101 RepID=A0ABQ9GEQ4_9NEOP|nr:hypothetical protein PR048_028542 [Dryococelus australis]